MSGVPHICFFAPTAWPVLSRDLEIESVGGAEVQQVTLARALASRGYLVSMLCGDHGQPDEVTIDGIRAVRHRVGHSQVPVIRYVHPRLTAIWASLQRVDADILYQRTAAAATGVVGLFAKATCRRFVYAAAHDLDMVREKTPQLFQRRAGGRDLRLFRLGVKLADAIVVQHAGQAADCLRSYGRASTVIPSCYAENAGDRADAGGVVLWVATLRTWKRPEKFLEIAKRLPNVRFRMVGGPSSDAVDATVFERVRSDAARLQNVEFVGFVPYAEVDQHFNAARVFVNTSDHEGFPNTFLQAWSRGVPTVSFCETGATLDGAPVGAVAQSTEAMGNAVERLMRDDILWRREGARAKRYVTSTHSVDAAVAAYERVFAPWTDAASAKSTEPATTPIATGGSSSHA